MNLPGRRAAFVRRLTLIAFLAGSMAHAGGPGSAFGEGLRLTNTAWAVAMSSAMAASAEGVNAIALNPAGVLDASLTSFHLTHSFYVTKLAEDYLAYSQRFPLGTAVGISVHGIYDSSNARTIEDADGNYAGEIGKYPLNFAVAGAAYAMDLARYLPALAFLKPTGGASLRAVWQQVAQDSWLGATIDAGFKVRTGLGLTVGGVLQNLGVIRGKNPLPLQWVTGLAWQGDKVFYRADRFLIEADSPVALDRPLSFRLGSEYRVQYGKVSVAVRAGWKQENEVPGAPGVSGGFGFRWFMGLTPWGLDYAYVPWGILGGQHCVALTVALVPPPPREEKPVESKVQAVFYPGRGEAARAVVDVDEPAELSVSLQDESGMFIMILYERRVVWTGSVEVTWDGRMPDGRPADIGRTYRFMIQLGSRTSYEEFVPKEEPVGQ